MHRGLYIAASGMMASQTRQDVLANNLANASNHGFKRLVPVQSAYRARPFNRINDEYQWTPKGFIDPRPPVGMVGGGVGVVNTSLDMTAGGLVNTGNNTDLALVGSGFFVVATPQGDALTREGSFRLDADGRLVNSQGYPVLGKQGTILIDDPGFRVDPDGLIHQEGMLEGDRVMVVDADPAGLVPLGNGSYRAEPGKVREAEEGSYSIKQEHVEGSNVNSIKEMMEMLTLLRSYEANQRLVTYQDELEGKVANDLATVR